jgi:predicted nucleic acid-binding protein
MNYLLDTCVISEFTRQKPGKRVVEWVNSLDEEKLFLSVVTIGEIQHGISLLPESRRKTKLLTWLEGELVKRFGARILPLDTATLVLSGSLSAQVETKGQPIGVMDSLLAATALRNNLIIATRNVLDFQSCGAQVINPWK